MHVSYGGGGGNLNKLHQDCGEISLEVHELDMVDLKWTNNILVSATNVVISY